jgi:hypothetical protein
MVGSIYLGCVLVLTVLLQLAARDAHETTEDRDIFRFPRILVNSLRVAVFVPGLLGVLIYRTFSAPGVLDTAVLIAGFSAMTVILLAMFIQVATFSVAVSKQCLKLNVRKRQRTLYFEHIREVVVVWPWRGNGRLDLMDASGARLCRIDGGVQDFDQLVYLVKLYCPHGATTRERDVRGHWT